LWFTNAGCAAAGGPTASISPVSTAGTVTIYPDIGICQSSGLAAGATGDLFFGNFAGSVDSGENLIGP
jgi:hypothetical protein